MLTRPLIAFDIETIPDPDFGRRVAPRFVGIYHNSDTLVSGDRGSNAGSRAGRDTHGLKEQTLAEIRPISDLRNKSREISRICHETGEPVFITKNGEGDLVVVSHASWERQQARLDLYTALDEAEADVRAGDRGIGVTTMRARLRATA